MSHVQALERGTGPVRDIGFQTEHIYFLNKMKFSCEYN